MTERVPAVRFISGVIMRSADPDRLATFYRERLGVPLEREEHGGPPHWGCELGDIHFAIHPAEGPTTPSNAMRVAFTVFDLDAYLNECGVTPKYGPVALGEAGSRVAAVVDPDGNEVELTELGDHWMKHLEERRAAGEDVVVAWRQKSS